MSLLDSLRRRLMGSPRSGEEAPAQPHERRAGTESEASGLGGDFLPGGDLGGGEFPEPGAHDEPPPPAGGAAGQEPGAPPDGPAERPG